MDLTGAGKVDSDDLYSDYTILTKHRQYMGTRPAKESTREIENETIIETKEKISHRKWDGKMRLSWERTGEGALWMVFIS